jgi:hypothetical protein
MNNTLVAGEINDYGSTQKEELLVVPSAMMDRNYHTNTKHYPSSSSPSWNTKKAVVLGIIGSMAVVVSSALLFFSVIIDSSGQARTQSFLLHDGGIGYPRVAIKNDTPYPVPYRSYVYINYAKSIGMGCRQDFIPEGIVSGDTWTEPTSRGLCLVKKISAVLTLPDRTSNAPYGELRCTPYKSSGTSYSIYSIIMDGDDRCCVRNSHQSQKCS